MRLTYVKGALKDLESIERTLRDRIRGKLLWFASQEEPLSFAELLTGMPGIFRYRVGAYRVFVTPEGTVLLVLRIRKRSEAYR